MTEKPLTKKQRAQSIKLAAEQFEPWQIKPEMFEFWKRDRRLDLGMLHIALSLLKFTKPELAEKFDGLNDLFERKEGEDPLNMQLFNELGRTRDFFEGAAEIIDMALARLKVVVAGKLLEWEAGAP
jgi:hypothetical protein